MSESRGVQDRQSYSLCGLFSYVVNHEQLTMDSQNL